MMCMRDETEKAVGGSNVEITREAQGRRMGRESLICLGRYCFRVWSFLISAVGEGE